MESTSTISRTVMRRVHTIHAIQPLFSGTAFASLLLLVALWGIGREVWVAHVIQNMSSLTDVIALERFIVAAFLNTGLLVQALSILTLAAAVWLVRDGVRSLEYARRIA